MKGLLRTPDDLVGFAEDAVRRAEAAGADLAEAFVREGRTLALNCKGRLASPTESHSVGFALRVAVGKRVGMAGSSGLHRVDHVVQEALFNARGAPESRHFTGFAAPAHNTLHPSTVHPDILEPEPARLQALADRAMSAFDVDGVTFAAFGITTGRSRFAVANSHGVATWDQGGRESAQLEVRVSNATRDVTAWDSWSSLLPADGRLDLEDFVARCIGRAAAAQHPEPLDTPVDTVILDTAPASQIFIRLLGHLSGALVNAKQSALGDRLDERIVDKRITIHDRPHADPDDEDGRQILRIDHEGTPTTPLPLIENGVLRHFLYDTQSAAIAGVASTGHGLRGSGWGGGVGVSAIQPHMRGGSGDLDQLIAGAERAVYMPEALTGMFTANATTGDFSATVPYAFYVENGEIRHALANTTIGGNILRMLDQVHDIGRDVAARRTGTYPPIHLGGVSCAT